jgi:hypothetical protein
MPFVFKTLNLAGVSHLTSTRASKINLNLTLHNNDCHLYCINHYFILRFFKKGEKRKSHSSVAQ